MKRQTTSGTFAILAILILAGTLPDAIAQTVSVSMTEGPRMTVPRMNHIQVPLADGKVALLGGHTTDFKNLSTADIWEPTSGTLSTVPMAAGRDWSAIARLLDGRYLIAGGTGDGGNPTATDTAEVFDPSSLSFSATGTMTRVHSLCSGATVSMGQTELAFSNENAAPVVGNPTSPTTFSLTGSTFVAEVWTYHWNDGQGREPGTISLRHSDGTVYGPWQTRGQEGLGEVDNAYWLAEPGQAVKSGTYTVIDSDPASWSRNVYSDGKGFARVVKGLNAHAGKILVVGGWDNAASSRYGDVYNPQTGAFTATTAMNTPRCNPILFPTEDGRIVVCGGHSYDVAQDPLINYEQVEIYNPATNAFTVLRESLFVGETGWRVNTYSRKRPVDSFRLSDGRYLFYAYSPTSPNGTTLAIFDPVAVTITKAPVTPEFSVADRASVAAPPLLDSSRTKAYLILATTMGSQRSLSVDVVDFATGKRARGINNFTMPGDYYFGATGESLLDDGRLFVTGGHSEAGEMTNHTPVRRTFFLTPQVNAPQDQLVGELVLHVQLVSGWAEPEGRPVRYRYVWTSNGGDPVVTHGPKSDLEDILRPGDNGVTFDQNEAWTVTITAVNDQGTEGPSISGLFRIGSNLLVGFEGWIFR